MNRLILLAAQLSILSLSVPSEARDLKRDPHVRAQWMLTHPCPSTGKTRGACPGYQADHRIPICFYGPDAPWNLQWLSVKDHLEKTKLDVKVCKWDGK